jgi:hypothetical protein
MCFAFSFFHVYRKTVVASTRSGGSASRGDEETSIAGAGPYRSRRANLQTKRSNRGSVHVRASGDKLDDAIKWAENDSKQRCAPEGL